MPHAAVRPLPPPCPACKTRDHVRELSQTATEPPRPMWVCYGHPDPRPLYPTPYGDRAAHRPRPISA